MPSAGFDLGAFRATPVAFRAVAGNVSAVRWSMLFDLFGSYLLLIPVTLFLWKWLTPKNPSFVALCSLCGVSYCLFGAMGAAVLAAVIPAQLTAYAQATGFELQVHEAVLTAFTNAVYHGVWGLLDTMLAGVWWIGIGAYLRGERRIIGSVTILLGVSYLFSGSCRVLGAETAAMAGLVVYFVLAPIWAASLGIDLLRTPVISIVGPPLAKGSPTATAAQIKGERLA